MNLAVGQEYTLRRVFSPQDFSRFARLSGDDNPIHVDPEFSARTRFGRPVAHGMLLYGVLCGALAEFAPGLTQVSQELMFPSPTYAEELITVHLRVSEVESQGLARIDAVMTRPGGEVVCRGGMRVRETSSPLHIPKRVAETRPPMTETPMPLVFISTAITIEVKATSDPWERSIPEVTPAQV